MADPRLPAAFDLDLALSADLDGELETYARELGASPEVLRNTLETAEARDRRAVLAAVRTRLLEPGPGPDDLTRRRLTAAAGDALPPAPARSGRARPAWGRLAAVAAILLLAVVGIVAVTTRGGDESSSKDGAASRAAVAPRGDLGDLGRLDQGRIDALTGAGSAARSNESTTPSAGAQSTAAPATPTQVQRCSDGYGAEGSVRFRAAGTYDGRAAVVLGVESGARTIVFVVAADDCAQVLYSASR